MTLFERYLQHGLTVYPAFDGDNAEGGAGESGGESGAGDGPGEAEVKGDGEAGGESAAAGESGESGEAGGDEFDRKKAEAKITKVNSEAANLRKRLKELEPLAKEAQDLKDAQKSESEKSTEARTKAEKTAADATQEAARLRVALNKGLSEVQAKRLIGENQEELEADADELLESFKSKDGSTGKEPPEGKKSETPKGGERTGATGDTDGEETDPRKLAARLPSYS
jgi:chromosome segregation ATPase